MEDKNVLPNNDAGPSGDLLPEAVGFSIYHAPQDERAVIGFRFDIRCGAQTFSASFVEGEYRNHPADMVKYLDSGETFMDLVSERHEQIAALQAQVLGHARETLDLLRDIRA